MILVTGGMRSGKTLYTISELSKEFGDMPVFYHDIEGLKMPTWVEYKTPRNWHNDLPDNCILVVDEAHKVWPVRSGVQAAPPDEEAMAEQGHRGIRIVLITQHPNNLSAFVRRLVTRHIHVHRSLGLLAATVFTWDFFQEHPNGKNATATATRARWSYNKKFFGKYVSAVNHDQYNRKRIPAFIYVIPFAAVAVLGFGYLGINSMTKIPAPEDFGKAFGSKLAPGVAGTTSGAQHAKHTTQAAPTNIFDPMNIGATQVVAVDRQLPHKQPMYAKLDEPKRAPHPAACVQRAEASCVCYTQDATILDIDPRYCQDFVQGKVFAYWKKDHAETKRYGDESGVELSAANKPRMPATAPAQTQQAPSSPPITIPDAPVTTYRSNIWTVPPASR